MYICMYISHTAWHTSYDKANCNPHPTQRKGTQRRGMGTQCKGIDTLAVKACL